LLGAAIPDAIVMDEIKKDPLVKRHLERIADLEWEVEKLRLAASDGEKDAEVKKAQKLLQAAQEALEARKKKIRPEVVAGIQQRASARSQRHISGLKDRIAYLKKYIEILDEDEKRLDDGDRNINRHSLDLEAQQNEMAQLDAVAKKLGAEIQTMEVELKAPARVTLVEPATVVRN
jgi:hypothetical protein